jgi:hypothetical protein
MQCGRLVVMVGGEPVIAIFFVVAGGLRMRMRSGCAVLVSLLLAARV